MSFEKVLPTSEDKKILGDESVERLLNIIWFNLSRKENTNELKEIFKEVLEKIKRRRQMNHSPKKTIEYLEMILCTIVYTRDIRYGKGERDLTYMMIYALYKFFPIPAIYLMKEIVGQKEESYGSWKDIPRLCDYIKKETNERNPLITTLVEMAINQLKRDEPSNVAKWIPRENSKYGWLFDIFVKNYYQLSSEPTNENRRTFRKLISRTNRKLDAPEIDKATLKSWTKRRDLPFNKHTPIKDVNFSIPIDHFIKKAKTITEDSDKKRLDGQWIKYSKQWSELNKYIIPLVDVSADTTEYEYNSAIGIGILLSQNSLLRNRMICFSQTASWISLSQNLGFTDTVKEIMSKVPAPTSRLINTGFDLIKEAILETKMEKDQINNLEVVVISNFANDTCHDYQYMVDNIFNGKITEQKIKNIPNLTYWNISQNLTIPNKEKKQCENHNKGIKYQHYPPGTQENYNSFSSRDLMMEKGKELKCSRRAGGGKGLEILRISEEPGVPPIKYIAGQVSLDEFISNKTKMETMRKILSNPRYDKIRNMFENLRDDSTLY